MKLKPNDGDNFTESLISVRRVTKVVKGGRKFAFSVLVLVGNRDGTVGFASSKAQEVTAARLKASRLAKKNLITIPLYKGRTIYHDIVGVSGASKVLLRKAQPGTGIICGGAMRAVFELLGVQDIVTKSLGSSNPYNIVRATFNGLLALSSYRSIADRRGKKVSDL